MTHPLPRCYATDEVLSPQSRAENECDTCPFYPACVADNMLKGVAEKDPDRATFLFLNSFDGVRTTTTRIK